jgi:hypothetical protein
LLGKRALLPIVKRSAGERRTIGERTVTTPRVTENLLALASTERDDFADEPAREPRRPPYHRPSQREIVRQSLDYGVYRDVYPNRKVA